MLRKAEGLEKEQRKGRVRDRKGMKRGSNGKGGLRNR